MKVYDNDGDVLLELTSLERAGNEIKFSGVVMGSMPVQGILSPEETRKSFPLISRAGLWFFLLTFLFRRSR